MPRLVPIDGGDIRLSAQQSAVARPWDPDGPPPGKKPVYTCMSIWDYAAEDESRQHPHGRTDFHTRTITVDGRLDAAEWDGVPEMDIRRDGQSVATVKAVADRENLYLAYRVKDPHALQNIGTELPYCPFTSGGYIDFCFGHSWSVPQRQENAEGDVRVIMARITGTQAKDYHMAFFPVKRHDAHNPQVITSPAAQRHFDDIAAMPGLKWAYQITADGYSAEVCVKMHDYRTLGLSSGEPAGFDVSVGFANDAGTVRQAAAHWAGEQEAMVVDRPGSAALLPATWGTMVFDRNRVLPSVKP
jgi:hypothetical protein